jgi:ABC-type multidrug transport system ATPase subunit
MATGAVRAPAGAGPNLFHAGCDAPRGLYLQWRDLGLAVPLKGQARKDADASSPWTQAAPGSAAAAAAGGTTLTLLSGVTGQVGPGQLLAVMGASGAGKSTFLNVLARRVRTGTTGTVTVNGAAATSSFSRLHGYVTQDAPFFDSLTVRETLSYAAALRLPEAVPAATRAALVDALLADLDLTRCAHTFVGKPAEPGGISGGERRRLTLAMELTFNPPLLLCDEVTSGLDAASASRIVRILRRLASTQGRTVICTIHQPRPSILALFDQVLVLAGGRTAYYGPGLRGGAWDPAIPVAPAPAPAPAAGPAPAPAAAAGPSPSPAPPPGLLPADMVEYFRDGGFDFRPGHNPADELLDLVNGEDDEEEDGGGGGGGSGGGGDASPPGALKLRVAAEALAKPPPRTPASGSSADIADVEVGTLSPLPSRGARRAALIARLVDRYARSPLAAAAAADPPVVPPPATPSFDHLAMLPGGTVAVAAADAAATRAASTRAYPTSWLTQVRVITARSFFYKLRNPDAVMSQAVSAVAMSLVCGSIYYQLGLGQAAARDRLAAISFIFLTQSFMAFDVVVLFPAERSVYLRDTASGLYSSSAFYVGRSAAEFPIHAALAAIAGLVTYGMYGLGQAGGADRLGIYVLLMVLVTNAGASLLILVGAVSSSMAMGNALATVVLSFASLFNGLFVSPRNIPAYFRWVAAISFPGIAVKGAMVNELRGLTFTCGAGEPGCVPDGDTLLDVLGMAEVDPWEAAGWLLLESVVFRALAFFALHMMHTGQPLRDRARLLLPGAV